MPSRTISCGLSAAAGRLDVGRRDAPQLPTGANGDPYARPLGPQQPADRPQQRRLPRAVRADQRDDLASVMSSETPCSAGSRRSRLRDFARQQERPSCRR